MTPPRHPTNWRPMHTAPEAVGRIWLDHLTLGPILAEGRPGRWYSPSAARQVWRWYRPAEPDALQPFGGWLPYEALAAQGTNAAITDDPQGGFAVPPAVAEQLDPTASFGG